MLNKVHLECPQQLMTKGRCTKSQSFQMNELLNDKHTHKSIEKWLENTKPMSCNEFY